MQASTIRRGASWITVRAEFEYGFDDGSTVWGGRVAEEVLVTVDRARGVWDSPRSLHGEWRALKQLQAEFSQYLEPDAAAQGQGPATRASTEVELASLTPICDTV